LSNKGTDLRAGNGDTLNFAKIVGDCIARQDALPVLGLASFPWRRHKKSRQACALAAF